MVKIDPPICQKYGIPFYGAAWVPPKVVFDQDQQENDEDSGGGSSQAIQSDCHVVLAGGGGEGRSGISNAVIISRFDLASNSLSDSPVAKLLTGVDLPYRMAVHPGGEGIICSLPKSCRWYEWDKVKSDEDHKLGLKLSEKVLTHLEDVGQQLALRFNDDGSFLAVGGEEGNLRVFKWPSMEVVIDEADAHKSVKDLDFGPDGKFLVSLGGGSPGRVWDVGSSTVVASLPKKNDEVFGFCRFSQNTQILYTTVMQDKGGSIVTWNTTSWKRIQSKHIVRDAISAFDVSPNGKLVAVGTVQGDVVIMNAASMRVLIKVRKAHLGIVTALTFSHDSRALVSASMDSSVRVTVVTEKTSNGFGLWVIIVFIILAIAAYVLKSKEILP